MSKLTSVVVEHNPSAQPITHTVIWLHGLGASGHDFEPIVPNLGLVKDTAVRLFFPMPQKSLSPLITAMSCLLGMIFWR